MTREDELRERFRKIEPAPAPPPVAPKALVPAQGNGVVTLPVHYYAVRGIEWLRKRNPHATMLMSVATPNPVRLVSLRHHVLFHPLSGSEAVATLMQLPPESSIAWRRL